MRAVTDGLCISIHSTLAGRKSEFVSLHSASHFSSIAVQVGSCYKPRGWQLYRRLTLLYVRMYVQYIIYSSEHTVTMSGLSPFLIQVRRKMETGSRCITMVRQISTTFWLPIGVAPTLYRSSLRHYRCRLAACARQKHPGTGTGPLGRWAHRFPFHTSNPIVPLNSY